MKCQILFSRKKKKNIIRLSSAQSAHSIVSVKYLGSVSPFPACPNTRTSFTPEDKAFFFSI